MVIAHGESCGRRCLLLLEPCCSREDLERRVGVELVDVEEQVPPFFRQARPDDGDNGEGDGPDAETNSREGLLKVDVALRNVPLELRIPPGRKTEPREKIGVEVAEVHVGDGARVICHTIVGPSRSHFF